MEQARSLVDQQQFAQAVRLLSQLVEDEPDSAETRFWLAYATYKSGAFQEALDETSRVLELEPDWVDPHYLAGLAAFGAGRPELAREHFQWVVAQAGPAADLGRSAALQLAKISQRLGLAKARELIRKKRFNEAVSLLDDLLAAQPDDTDMAYHRAYAWFRMRKYETALLGFRGIVESHPDYYWARYMEAICLDRLGQTAEAADIMRSLLDCSDVGVSREARSALDSLGNFGTTNQENAGLGSSGSISWLSGGRWTLPLSVDMDSNPAYIPESSYVKDDEAATGFSLQPTGELLLLDGVRSTLALGAEGILRLYPWGPGEYELTQIYSNIEYGTRGREYRFWAGVGSGVSWLGWDLFLDLQETYLGGHWIQHSRTRSVAAMGAYRRKAHLEDYQNLDALGAWGRLGQRIMLSRRAYLEPGYYFETENAAAYSLSWSGTLDSGSGYEALITAEASFFGHGPRLEAVMEFPWRELRLDWSAGLSWRGYGKPEILVYDVDGESFTYEGQRRDRRTWLYLDNSFRAAGQLYLFGRFSGLFNSSTLSGEDWPSDRSYSRRLVSLGVELRG